MVPITNRPFIKMTSRILQDIHYTISDGEKFVSIGQQIEHRLGGLIDEQASISPSKREKKGGEKKT